MAASGICAFRYNHAGPVGRYLRLHARTRYRLGVAGRGIEAWSHRFRINPARFYAAAEFGIGIGAFTVPWLFSSGEDALLRLGDASSARYLLVSALYISVAMLPWCVLMGATFPLMMSFIRRIHPSDTTGFSFLYLANVIGAAAGAALTAGVLVELLGFRLTSTLAALVNFAIATTAFLLGGAVRGDTSVRCARRSIIWRGVNSRQKIVAGLASFFLALVLCPWRWR